MPQYLHEQIGPYERWAYGAGAQYALSEINVRSSPYVTAVAELPAGIDQTNSRKAAFAVADGTQSIAVAIPTLWQHAFSPQDRSFCPLVLKLKGQIPRGEPDQLGAIVSGLSALMASISRTKSLPSGGALNGLTVAEPLIHAVTPAECVYRVNTPVPTAAVNQHFSPKTIEGRYAKPRAGRVAPNVILAVVDDGIPFAHRNFRDKRDGTRIEFCWLQGAQAAAGPESQSVLFGRELTAVDIDTLIAQLGHDEDVLYRAASAERSAYPGATVNRFATHGAHVLDTAAGCRHGSAWDPGRPAGLDGDLDALGIIAVQLPAPVTLETASFGKDTFILSALHYILDRADRIAQIYHGEGATLPLIINFSYGFSGGPHNGRDRLERAIRALVQKRVALGAPTHLVMPSGNDFLSALYGRITKDVLQGKNDEQKHAFNIPWRIQPNDRTSNYLEIWLPKGAKPDGIAIKISDPAGYPVFNTHIESAEVSVWHEDIKSPGDGGGRIIGQISLENYGTGEGDSLWRIVIAIAPTEPHDPSHPAAQAGRWIIGLQNLQGATADGEISCRIQRDINPFGYARGARQSYFDDPLDEPFDSSGQRPEGDNNDQAFVRRFGTLNGLATHDAVIVVSGYTAQGFRPAEYSSAGSNSCSLVSFGQVHLAAPSETSPALKGVLAAGTRSGSVFRMSGTSTAAPQVSRALAVAHLRAAAQGVPVNPPVDLLSLLKDRIRPVDASIRTVTRVRNGAGFLVPEIS